MIFYSAVICVTVYLFVDYLSHIFSVVFGVFFIISFCNFWCIDYSNINPRLLPCFCVVYVGVVELCVVL
jgi:hypothetical protein